jgi:hypothetical protein
MERKGKKFQCKFSAPAATLRAMSPEVLDMIAQETGSKAIGKLLEGPITSIDRIKDIDWDFSWDFSWDYSTGSEIIQPQIQPAERK